MTACSKIEKDPYKQKIELLKNDKEAYVEVLDTKAEIKDIIEDYFNTNSQSIETIVFFEASKEPFCEEFYIYFETASAAKKWLKGASDTIEEYEEEFELAVDLKQEGKILKIRFPFE